MYAAVNAREDDPAIRAQNVERPVPERAGPGGAMQSSYLRAMPANPNRKYVSKETMAHQTETSALGQTTATR